MRIVQVCASILTLITAGVGSDDDDLLNAHDQRQARLARIAAATLSADAQKPPRRGSGDVIVELPEEEPPPRRVWDDDQIESLAKMLKRTVPEGARSLEVVHCHCSSRLVITPTMLGCSLQQRPSGSLPLTQWSGARVSHTQYMVQ